MFNIADADLVRGHLNRIIEGVNRLTRKVNKLNKRVAVLEGRKTRRKAR